MNRYYAIRIWNTTDYVIRIEKASSAKQACQVAFGTYYADAEYKVIHNPRYVSAKARRLIYSPDNWVKMEIK